MNECPDCGAPTGFRKDHPIGLGAKFRYSRFYKEHEQLKQKAIDRGKVINDKTEKIEALAGEVELLQQQLTEAKGNK